MVPVSCCGEWSAFPGKAPKFCDLGHLKISPNRRFLIQQDGSPFFISGTQQVVSPQPEEVTVI
jgi:hypothetical protein